MGACWALSSLYVHHVTFQVHCRARICSSSMFSLRFLLPLHGTRIWNSQLLLCSPELPAPGFSPPEQINFSLAYIQDLYPALSLSQDPEEATRSSTGGMGWGADRLQLTQVPLTQCNPSHHRNGNLWSSVFPLAGLPRKPNPSFWPHFPDQLYFLVLFSHKDPILICGYKKEVNVSAKGLGQEEEPQRGIGPG